MSAEDSITSLKNISKAVSPRLSQQVLAALCEVHVSTSPTTASSNVTTTPPNVATTLPNVTTTPLNVTKTPRPAQSNPLLLDDDFPDFPKHHHISDSPFAYPITPTHNVTPSKPPPFKHYHLPPPSTSLPSSSTNTNTIPPIFITPLPASFDSSTQLSSSTRPGSDYHLNSNHLHDADQRRRKSQSPVSRPDSPSSATSASSKSTHLSGGGPTHAHPGGHDPKTIPAELQNLANVQKNPGYVGPFDPRLCDGTMPHDLQTVLGDYHRGQVVKLLYQPPSPKEMHRSGGLGFIKVSFVNPKYALDIQAHDRAAKFFACRDSDAPDDPSEEPSSGLVQRSFSFIGSGLSGEAGDTESILGELKHVKMRVPCDLPDGRYLMATEWVPKISSSEASSRTMRRRRYSDYSRLGGGGHTQDMGKPSKAYTMVQVRGGLPLEKPDNPSLSRFEGRYSSEWGTGERVGSDERTESVARRSRSQHKAAGGQGGGEMAEYEEAAEGYGEWEGAVRPTAASVAVASGSGGGRSRWKGRVRGMMQRLGQRQKAGGNEDV